MTLYPYQLTGAEWLVRHGHAGLADDAGLGKTAQAIEAAKRMGAKRIRVACPAIARLVWQREFNIWWPESNIDLQIASYDALAAKKEIRQAWAASRPDILILDEAQYLKNRESRRTRAIYGTGCTGQKGISAACGAVWPLTATPTPNHPGELWTHLRALRPDLIPGRQGTMGYNEYLNSFCEVRVTPFGVVPVKLKRAADLQAIAKELFLKRRWQSVLTELPDWTWESVPIEAEDTLAALLEWERDHPEVAALVAELEQEGVQGPPAAHIASYRHWVGMVKAPAISALIAGELHDKTIEKIVVFVHHHDVLNALHAALYPFYPVQISGKTSPAARAKAIDAFQTDPGTRVILLQTQAAGIAITLTASRHVFFAEPEWVPADMYQSAKRVHRIGQKFPVHVRVAGLVGSLDDRIAAACARKAKMIDAIL